MQIINKICKLYLFTWFVLSTNASPILSSKFEQNYQVPSISSNVPGVTTTFRDQNGNLVTQVKKESFNNVNGQNSHLIEFEENKQLPNGYAKSFKKEYSSSSVSGSQPVFGQNPIGFDSSLKLDKLNCGKLCSGFEHGHHETLISANSGYTGINSNLKSIIDQGVKNLPGIITTFKDQNGNLVTQVKKELFNNENGQNSHVVEFEENKQLPNGYSKSFKKEYSSSSVIGSQPSILKPTIIENSSLDKQMSGYNSFINTKPITSTNLCVDQPVCDETGQAIVDTKYSGQKQVNFVQQGSNYQTPVFVPKQQTIISSSSNSASGNKYEKLESFNTHQHHGQQTVDITHSIEPTSFGQQSINIENTLPNFSLNQQKETFNQVYKPQSQFGQQVVEINKVSNFNQEIGQQTVPVEKFYKPNIQVGQQSIDISSISHNTAGQHQVEINKNSNLNQGYGQQTVSIDHFYQPHTQVGQQSIDISNTNHHTAGQQQVEINKNSNLNQGYGQQTVSIDHFYQPHTQVGQQSIDISNTNHHTAGQQQVEINKNSNYNQEYGQQSVLIDNIAKPVSQFGQQSIDITNLGHNTAGQQIVDINHNSNYNKQIVGQQAEKIESFYSENHDSRGQKSIDISGSDISNANSQSHFNTLSKGNQEFSGQQTQDIGGIFTTKNGGTHILDIGTLDKNTYNGKLTSPINYNGKEMIKIVEGQRVVEKNIDLNVPHYQSNAEVHSHQSTHGQSLVENQALGQETIDFSSVVENNQPLQKLPGQNLGHQSSSYSSYAEKSSSGNDQSLNGNYNKVFGSLNKLEQEINGVHSLSNLKKDNIQVGLAHSLKSMPIIKEEKESYFQKKLKENEQYLEPQSEYIPGKHVQSFASSSYTKSEKSVDC
ncbi:uncharacterized protein LOC126895379 [Daktulosphaira vitifoliae]|uniref:uncharacterized protein LOC126895379 n=1 Tax=Daktulosphaira vitifoliae TaxID=58002 RepID=UPI0021AAF61B|nr:uncharacterized protein LOC126895379 [Daktulosphaira vitifoliae]